MMFSRRDAWNKTVSCATTPILERKDCCKRDFTLMLSTKTDPVSGSYMRRIKRTICTEGKNYQVKEEIGFSQVCLTHSGTQLSKLDRHKASVVYRQVGPLSCVTSNSGML
mmetsp:Transcript_19505/g.42396  ORF Transcript_19505/g.42396 Transcript_19505/m.42396 type:complete len:110 (-) Transcript_19505:89-418(-)